MSTVIRFEFSRDVCRRCGANEQATHHPLCESRDGTPTALSDAEVRRQIRYARWHDEHVWPLLYGDDDGPDAA